MYENVKTVDDVGTFPVALGFLKGSLIALVFTVLVFLIFAVVLSYTPIPEDVIPYVVFITQVIGGIISGFIPAKRAKTRGIITGGIAASLYMLFIWLISSLASGGFYFGKHILSMLLVTVFSGAVGGISGVNLKDSQTNKKKR